MAEKRANKLRKQEKAVQAGILQAETVVNQAKDIITDTRKLRSELIEIWKGIRADLAKLEGEMIFDSLKFELNELVTDEVVNDDSNDGDWIEIKKRKRVDVENEIMVSSSSEDEKVLPLPQVNITTIRDSNDNICGKRIQMAQKAEDVLNQVGDREEPPVYFWSHDFLGDCEV